jgi:peroxiredoxin Q/BCP
LRDHYAELTKAGYSILGVSADSVSAQAKFAMKFTFPYPLLADVDKELIHAFCV